MSPLRKQQALIEQYSVIPDVHERLSLILDRARSRPVLPAEKKTEEHRIQGCTSRVWLAASLENGKCKFHVDAESALVRGLAWLLCDVYQEATPAEVIAVETHVLEELGIAESLSPTRRHGIQQLRRALRDFAWNLGASQGSPKFRCIDAHNHLHDARLDPFRDRAIVRLERAKIVAAVVNGTREEDWPAVATVAAEHPWARPAFGLHPWYVQSRSAAWASKLAEYLDATPGASVGEIGLDRWRDCGDFDTQTEVFRLQLAMAAHREIPATVHCLKAWGPLQSVIESTPPPACGWLLHSYSGPMEMVRTFAKRGAYFSFSAYFLHERKEAQRAVFREVPLDRLLVETDAPDMLPPRIDGATILQHGDGGEALNSPENIELSYRGLAEVRGMAVEELAGQVEENFKRLFGAARKTLRTETGAFPKLAVVA